MYIHSIRIRKFRHLENEDLGPFSSNTKSSDLIAFAGPNGSGKSSVLELLSYALSNSYSLGWQLSRTFGDFSFEVGIGLSADERKFVIDGVQGDLASVEDNLRELTAGIAARTDLTEEQKQSQISSITSQSRRPHQIQYTVSDYLKNNSIYYRSFNFEGGEYAKKPQLHNHLHSIASRELKDKLKRSLGFFLRADRSYPQKGFDQRKIFAYESTRSREHLWSMAFNTSEIQYQDMYEFLVQLRYHYLRELGAYHNAKNKGHIQRDEPEDPIRPYEELLQRLFPHYKFADNNETIPSNLFIEIPSGETITFNDLSSGEKEVFFILSFFVRHNVENAIIVIDEPELHLHPELSRLLLRNMKSIRSGNQIWVATHNSEIVDEAGRDRVMYVARDATTRKSKFISAQTEQESLTLLRDLFGLSGYIGVARNLVFLEGDNSSQDRKFYSALFPAKSSNFRLVPAKSSDHLTRINGAVLSILESNIGSMNFFLVRDRDYLTDQMVQKYESHKSGRIFVLKRHEIENYLLEFESLSTVLEEIYGITQSPAELKAVLREVALQMTSGVIRDMTAFRLNLLVRPQDFSIGNVLANQAHFQQNGAALALVSSQDQVLKSKFLAAGNRINASISNDLSSQAIEKVLAECTEQVRIALETDHWLTLFPGKEMLNGVSKRFGISHVVSLQNSLIKELSAYPNRVDAELIEVFSKIESS